MAPTAINHAVNVVWPIIVRAMQIATALIQVLYLRAIDAVTAMRDCCQLFDRIAHFASGLVMDGRQ